MATLSDRYDHLVVGAGVAAAAAVSGIRSLDPTGTIALLGAEDDPPLYRPDLSKTLWLKHGARLEDSFLDTGDAEVHTGVTVAAIDTDGHTVRLADGRDIAYGRLLLATGGEPRTAGLTPGPRIVFPRTAASHRTLSAVAKPGTHAVVVGDGWIGGEMAAALTRSDVQVTLVVVGDRLLESVLPPGLAAAVAAEYDEHGVRTVSGMMASADADADGVTVRLAGGGELRADFAVIGIGITPRVDLAAAAGIAIDEGNGGVLVDDHLRTSAPDVYAVGDVASYPDRLLGRRRVEHIDAAEKMGSAAGRMMAGADEPYAHTPFFWSDLFRFGFEAVGEVTTRLQSVEDFSDDSYEKGVVYHLDGGRVRGVLLWNVWDSVPAARALIEETASAPLDDPAAVRGRIPLG